MISDELEKKPSDVRKKQISEFIYFTSLEYGAELVMGDKDTSLNGWMQKNNQFKLEL